MDVPAPHGDKRLYLARTLWELYCLAPEAERLETVDSILENYAVEPKVRDDLLKQLDALWLAQEKARRDLARVLLRIPIWSLEKEGEQLRLKFGE